MARGVNKVILVGNLGADPEVRYTKAGNAVANISVATSEQWKDKQTGQPQERTEWHRVVMFNRLGEIAGEYLRKGAKVYIEGQIRTRKWQNQSGEDQYTTEVVAKEMQMLDGVSNNGVPQRQAGGDYSSRAPGPSGSNNAATAPPAQPQSDFGDFDDDIPF